MTEKVQEAQPSVPLSDVPEFYTNYARIISTPYDMLVEHGVRYAEMYSPAQVPLVRIRTSLEHAWVIAKIMNRAIRKHIETVGPIALPKDMLKELQLEEEYRQDMGREND